MIKYRNFCFHYGDSTEYALKNVNLEIQAGEFVLISGPSGGGKSSFCRCLNGLIPHFYGGKVSGDVIVDGKSILKYQPRELAVSVGMTFQDPENQLTSMDVEREIVFGMENLAFSRQLMSKRLEESLDTTGISGLRHRLISELSGGEKQKVAIASVLALHPSVLVMDEPTSELDPKAAEDVLSVVQRLNDELGITVVLVEHRLERVLHLVDRLVLIDNGEIVSDGIPVDVFSGSRPFNLGIGVPPLIRLAHELNVRGKKVESIPLTVKEGRKVFDSVIRSAAGHKQVFSDDNSANKNPVILQTKNVWFNYSREQKNVLKNINLEFRSGELAAIMGRNASGKSTLLKLFNGIHKPVKGEVKVNGSSSKNASIGELSRTVGLVFQNPDDHLFANTVEKELSLTPENLGWDSGRIKIRVDELLYQFHLEKYRDSYPRYLSGGEKQRVALASAIAARPRILALDEPTRGMDYKLKTELMIFLCEYCKQGNTVILVSHDVEIVAEHAHRVILMSEGQVIIDGGRREVLSEALLFSPQINRLVQTFGSAGVPSDILTVDELVGLIE